MVDIESRVVRLCYSFPSDLAEDFDRILAVFLAAMMRSCLRIGKDWKLTGITANDQRVLMKLNILPPIDKEYVEENTANED